MTSRQDLCHFLLPVSKRHHLQREGVTTIKDLTQRPADEEVHLVSGLDFYNKLKVAGLYTGRVYHNTVCPTNVSILEFNPKLHCDSWQEFIAWLLHTHEQLRNERQCDVVCIHSWDFHIYSINDDFRLRKKVHLRCQSLATLLARKCDVIVLLN